MRLRAVLHLVGHHVRHGRGASGDKGYVDGHDLVDSPRPEPLAHIGCCKAGVTGTQHDTPNSFSRIRLRVVGYSGRSVADDKLVKKRVKVHLKELAAVIRWPSNSAPREIAMAVPKERLEAVLNLSSSCVAQVV
eukprot:6204031-Pleurochrysis_carterae.AAC.1